VGALRESEDHQRVSPVRHLTLVPPLSADHVGRPEPQPRIGTAGRLLLTFATMGLLGWGVVVVVSRVFG
jgi:hypothetical protein